MIDYKKVELTNSIKEKIKVLSKKCHNSFNLDLIEEEITNFAKEVVSETLCYISDYANRLTSFALTHGINSIDTSEDNNSKEKEDQT